MSETETRDPAVVIRDQRDQAWAELRRQDAELSRLRGVVEAVQAGFEALAAEWDTRAQAFAGTGIGDAYANAASFTRARLRSALAPVSSSGEAESGEGREHETFAYGQSGYDGDACRTCRWEGPPGSAAQHRAETRSPAPVPSGGQADGEGVRLRPDEIERLDFNYQVGDGRWLFTEVEGIIAARLAARPVLSREALRERLDGHWPVTRSNDRRLGCDCGWNARYGDGVAARDFTQWRDHLADVLAGGEQA